LRSNHANEGGKDDAEFGQKEGDIFHFVPGIKKQICDMHIETNRNDNGISKVIFFGIL
jgi:hypothetical protein